MRQPRRMRVVGEVILVSSVVAAACASQSADSAARLSAIESRLAKIESALERDASTEVPLVVDAGVEAGEVQVVRVPPQFYPDAAEDTPTRLANCKQSAESRCSEEIYNARFERERAKKGALRWLEIPRVPADSTPEGRACVRREHSRCEKMVKPDPLFEWLDAQLAPGKRDEKLTAEVRERVAKQLGIPPEKVDVACAPQFCRLIGDHRGVSIGEDFDHGTSSGSLTYMMRRGFSPSQ